MSTSASGRAVWDSKRAYNGCLSLFDLRDLSQQIRMLELKRKHEQEQERPHTTVRKYAFRRVTPMELLRQQEERRRQQQQQEEGGAAAAAAASSSSSSRRVLLPAVTTEDEAAVGTDLAYFLEGKSGGSMGSQGRVLGGDGLVVFVEEEQGKVRVMRDRRTKEDLLAAFPEIDSVIVASVWARTRLFAAASTVLASLRNSGHVDLAHHCHIDLNLDDTAVWPALDEVFGTTTTTTTASASASASASAASSGGGGWEHVALPEGAENWVLIEEEMAGLALGGPAEAAAASAEEEEGAGGVESDAAAGASESAGARRAPTGAGRMSYSAALTANLMEGDEGVVVGSVASRRFFPSSSSAAAARRKRAKVEAEKKAAAAADDDDDEEGGGSFGGGGGGWHEEYVQSKAVAARTRKHIGRKRLTETGKARMAAKLAKRRAAQGGAGSGGGSEGDDSDAMEW